MQLLYRSSSLQQSKNEGVTNETSKQDQGKRREKKKIKKKSVNAEDFALDIRPDPVQAKDILVSTTAVEDYEDV